MSKIHGCPCGAVQSDVAFPTHNKVHIISDEALDGATNYGAEPITIDTDRFDEGKREGYFCYACGRLLILEEGKLRVFEEVK